MERNRSRRGLNQHSYVGCGFALRGPAETLTLALAQRLLIARWL
jgi:hypothetical protein